MSWDLVVVGGGPAGLATAIAARMRGLSVAVLDRGHPPIDKACGEGLMPDGLATLTELGVSVSGRPFRGIRYLDGELRLEGAFPSGPGLGIRRPVLHAALVDRAQELGVELRWNEPVTGLSESGVATARGDVEAATVVGADGLHSKVRRWAGMERPGSSRSRYGVRCHFEVKPWTDLVEVHWGDGVEAYVTPVGEREVGVAMLWSGRKARFDDLLAGFPALADRLQGVPRSSPEMGAGPFRQRVRAVARGRIALVGDASGYLDAITGEGLALAFQQATALVDAVVAGDLRSYARSHRRLGSLPTVTTSALLWLEPRPRLRRRVMGRLASDPELFTRLLGMHARQIRVGEVGLGRLIRLMLLGVPQSA